jgi:hypothetical protein
MELKVTHRSVEHNNIGRAMLDPTSAFTQVSAASLSPLSMTELAAHADPAGPDGDDVARFGSRAANMLSGARRLVALAASDERENVFRRVAATMVLAVEDKWITEEVKLSRLQSIAEQHGLFDLSPDQLEEVIAGAACSPPKTEPAQAEHERCRSCAPCRCRRHSRSRRSATCSGPPSQPSRTPSSPPGLCAARRSWRPRRWRCRASPTSSCRPDRSSRFPASS